MPNWGQTSMPINSSGEIPRHSGPYAEVSYKELGVFFLGKTNGSILLGYIFCVVFHQPITLG